MLLLSAPAPRRCVLTGLDCLRICPGPDDAGLCPIGPLYSLDEKGFADIFGNYGDLTKMVGVYGIDCSRLNLSEIALASAQIAELKPRSPALAEAARIVGGSIFYRGSARAHARKMAIATGPEAPATEPPPANEYLEMAEVRRATRTWLLALVQQVATEAQIAGLPSPSLRTDIRRALAFEPVLEQLTIELLADGIADGALPVLALRPADGLVATFIPSKATEIEPLIETGWLAGDGIERAAMLVIERRVLERWLADPETRKRAIAAIKAPPRRAPSAPLPAPAPAGPALQSADRQNRAARTGGAQRWSPHQLKIRAPVFNFLTEHADRYLADPLPYKAKAELKEEIAKHLAGASAVRAERTVWGYVPLFLEKWRACRRNG
jgi:hypothetical protein